MSRAVATEVFSIDQFKDAYPQIFKCEEILKELVKEQKVHGVQQFNAPITFFSVSQYRPVMSPKTGKYGIEFCLYHGPNGLNDSQRFKPSFRINIMDDEFRFSFKRRFFEQESDFIILKDPEALLENMIGWMNSYASSFQRKYEARGGVKNLDTNEFMMRAVKLAMQQKRMASVQDTIDPNSTRKKREEIEIPELYLSPEDVENEANETDFSKVADLRIWGRNIEHVIAEAVKKIKTSFIHSGTNGDLQLQQQVDKSRTHMATLGGIHQVQRKGLLSKVFGNRKKVVKLSAYEYLEQAFEQFSNLSSAIFIDQNDCLELMSQTEGFTTRFAEYGDTLFLYKAVLDREYRELIHRQTGLDGKADDQTVHLRNNVKARRDELKTSHDVWRGSNLGIENFIACKNSQYEALETLKSKIDQDVMLLIQTAMAKTMPTGSAPDKEGETKVISEMLEQVTPILNELQGVINMGHEYNHALINGTMEEMKPITNAQESAIKLIAAPISKPQAS